MEIILVIGVVAALGLLGWIAFKLNGNGQKPGDDQELKGELIRLQTAKEQLEKELKLADEEIYRSRELENAMREENSTLKANYDNIQTRLKESRQELEQLNEKFTTEFKVIANELLDEKSHKFTEQNKQNIGEILGPLKEKIQQFEKKVEDTHKESLEKNAALKQQILGLKELNEQMSKDALNLTKALKGDSKAQGNWGEVILERLLEKSGLVKGTQYEIQESVTQEDGRRLQPDVVIKLPENKNVIVDSKVSLVAYEKYCSTDDDTEREAYLKEHIRSLRAHIKGLSQKEYHNIYQVGSLDFVLLFVPIEPAFSLAFLHDSELYNEALEKNIVVVSTSTLLATLRTISSIWRQENQNRYAVEIAIEGGKLYDKFKGFVDDLLEVGRKMDSSKRSYEDAMKKLSTGPGNLVKRVENLKKLGAKASKALPSTIVEMAEESDDDESYESLEEKSEMKVTRQDQLDLLG